MDTFIGEVILTSTTEFVGQCRRNGQPPAHGAFIRVGREKRCVGVVYNVETTSIDPNRRPMALEIPEEEIPKAYPQLAGLLRSQFHAVAVGEYDRNAFRFGLPETPPALHARIELCDESEIREIGRDYGFLRLLYNSGKPSPEELLLSACRKIIDAHGGKREEAVRLGKAISELFRDEYDTLRRLLARLESWL